MKEMTGVKSFASRCVHFAIISGVTFASCVLAIGSFYRTWTRILYPFNTLGEETLSVVITASIATLASSWAVWLGVKLRGNLTKRLILSGLATQLSLTAYAIIGLRIAVASNSTFLNFFFPSIFFAEYNWLTFIFEIAPITSIAQMLLLYFLLRSKSV